ncbi:hypothetical protein HHK36_001264 [Tetracentron sinense]|uniref:Uncharacterized protein n=1 Tax=Tetracentron sinense TaxID=13715 RepID=A0A834ZXV2_TETSI|nr:hypothetical protein HHK36_001264 [Tetracentron sinense]
MDPPTRSRRIYSRNMKFSDVYRGDDLIDHLKEIHDYQSAFRESKIFKSFRNPPISFFSMTMSLRPNPRTEVRPNPRTEVRPNRYKLLLEFLEKNIVYIHYRFLAKEEGLSCTHLRALMGSLMILLVRKINDP